MWCIASEATPNEIHLALIALCAANLNPSATATSRKCQQRQLSGNPSNTQAMS